MGQRGPNAREAALRRADGSPIRVLVVDDEPTPDGAPVGGSFLGPQGPGSIGAVVRGGTVLRAELIDQGGVRTDIPATDLAHLAAVAPADPPEDLELSGVEYRVDAVVGSDGLTYVLGARTTTSRTWSGGWS